MLDTLAILIKASLAKKEKKIEPLEQARTWLEILKHLIRTEYELRIITEKQYINLEKSLVESSKMANGWIKYLTQTPA